MRTNEVIELIESNGGLDMQFIEWNARREGKTVRQYIKEYAKGYDGVSDYVANKVAEYYY